MKIGYNEATGKGCSTLWEDLTLCEKVGFDYIEIRLDMLREYLKKGSIKELKNFFENSRVRPHALNALYTYKEYLGSGDDIRRQRRLSDEFQFGCEIAREIGSQYFIIVPPLQPDLTGGPFIGSKEENFENCVRILTQLSDLAAPYGVNCCFELVGFARSSVRSMEEARRIVTAVDKKNVGYVFDAYNIYLNRQLNEYSAIKKVEPEKIFAVHINNADEAEEKDMGQHKRRFCDTGILDLDNFLQNLKEIEYDGMVSVETFRPEYWGKPPEWVVSQAYLTTKACLKKNHCL